MSGLAIRVRGLSKQFKIGAQQARYSTLRDQLASGVGSLFRRRRRTTSDDTTFWALKDVSFEVEKGQVVGIIGRNGAGKSTLLKLLSRITEPTAGSAEIHGRVASLLEVGTGFHSELTGRENIYLNGSILGMRKAEIDRMFDEIVAFSEVERFIDTPVKHYSSGMYLRLAFAVAAHLQPEILLVDEVLAVGDAAFQRKCLGKMGDVARQGRTIIFVSHNMEAVEGLCSVAHMLERGRLIQSGNTAQVIESYLSSLPMLCKTPLSERTDRSGDGKLRFTGIEFLGSNGASLEVVQAGRDVLFSVGYTSAGGDLRNVEISIDIFTPGGHCMIIMNNEIVGAEFEIAPKTGRFACRIERFPLSPGQYPITLFCRVNGTIADWVPQATVLTVEGGDFYGSGRLPPPSHGGFLVPQQWSLESSDGDER